ncbi:hypothetical protein [Niveibacterium sp. SC-1]
MSTLFHSARINRRDHAPMDRALLQQIGYSLAQGFLPLLLAAAAVFMLA